ncbi:MAG TPA: transglutaminase-like cysteine peptidase, partial [Gammaproteobacteria bacterium]
VNRQVPYRTDTSNWLRKDIWNTPREALMRGGDCEDMALLKMVSLHLLGWPQERLLVVIGARAHGDSARTHALLLTLLDDGSQVVLDNQSRLVMSPSDYFSDFQPALAIGADSFALVQAH